MSVQILFFILVVAVLVILSIRERINRYLVRSKDWEIIGDSKNSPLSLALTHLVGTAGGLYLAVVLLVTFLELNVPARVEIMKFSLEPLAAVSILMAIVQPFLLRLWKRQ